jgi:hypothetical protein
MIVTIGVDAANRVLRVIADGAIEYEEIRAHLVEERAEDALGYRELIDARRAWSAMTAEDLRHVVALVRGEARDAALGPTAVVVSTDVAYGVLRTIEMLVEDVAAIRPFRDHGEAVRWLAGAPARTTTR